MNALGIFLTIVLFAAVAFAIYYELIKRLLHIELRATEIHTILTPDGWRIRLFRYRKGGSSGEPVLFVHGYMANHWNLATPAGDSIVDYLSEKGYDCWTIDLRGNRTSVPPTGTARHRATYDGYVMQDLPTAVTFIRRATGYDQVHWVGHSMGGMLLYAYEAAHGRAHLASGTTIGSPPWLEPYWSKTQDRMVRMMEMAPALSELWLRASTPVFAWMKPQHPMVPVRWDNLNPKFGAAELTSTVELPPAPVTRTFEEFAKHRYLGVDNDRVNVFRQLNRLETPLFVMACAIDPIAPVANLKSFFDRLPSEDKRFLELSKASGCEKDHAHVDPPFAKNALREVFEPVLEWISAHPARRTQYPAANSRIAEALEVVEYSAPHANAQEARVYSEIAEPSDSGRDGTLWGHALKNAAAVLSDLESDSPTEIDARPSRKSAAPRKRRTDSSPGKRSKKKVSTKAKKSASLTAAKTSKPAAQSGSQKKARKPVERHSATDDRSAAGTPRARKTSTKAKARIRRSKDER